MSATRYYARAYDPDGLRLVEWAGIAPGEGEAMILAEIAIQSARLTLGLKQGKPRIELTSSPYGRFASIWVAHQLYVGLDARDLVKRPAPMPIARVRRLIGAALSYGSPTHLRTEADQASVTWNVEWRPYESGPIADVSVDGPLDALLAMRPGAMAAIAHACLSCEPPRPGAHGYRDVIPEQQPRMATQGFARVPPSATLRAALAPASRLACAKAAATLTRYLEADGQEELAETIRREAAKATP